jgi:serine/threonine protein kinase/regulator of sirC expression with transglutaminase-like and TPR domain
MNEPPRHNSLNLEQSYGLSARLDPLIAPHGRLAFETLSKLGEGGMGTVYKVRDKRNGREAALKIISEKLAPLEDQERFIREAQITMSLNHPSIPPVFELGRTVQGELFMLMKLIQGKTLKDRIQEIHSKEPTESEKREVIEILLKVGEALSYAHSRGIIHRDIKPANIMIGAFGEVLLMDWGIAKDLNLPESNPGRSKEWPSEEELAAAGTTLTGAALGTPGYMAPEQAAGDKDTDERADIYAFALVLAEALGGEPLIQAPNPLQKLINSIKGERISLNSKKAAIPAEILWILDECLQINPERRPRQIAGPLQALRARLNGDEIPGFPYSWSERLNRRIRKHPTQVQGLFLGTLLLASLLSLRQTRIESQEKSSQLNLSREEQREAQVRADTLERISHSFQELENESKRGKITNLDQRLKDILTLSARSYESLLRAAAILENTEELALRKSLLSEAAQAYPPAYESLFELYKIEFATNHDALAAEAPLMELLQRAQSRNEVNEYSLLGAGALAQRQGELDRAMLCYDKALQQSSRIPMIYNNRGLLRAQKGDREGALEDLRCALELDPNNSVILTNRGTLHLNTRDFKSALLDFDRALELNPKACLANLQRGITLFRSFDKERALADFNKAIELGAADSPAILSATQLAKAWYHRGLISAEHNESALAISEFTKAIALNPNDAEALFERAILYYAKNDKALAHADLDKVLELNTKNALAYLARAQIHRDERNLELALSDLDMALSLNPNFAKALRIRGLLHQDAGRHAAACQDFRRYLDLAPDAKTSLKIRERLKKSEARLARGQK